MTEPTEIPSVTPEPVPTSTSTQTRFPNRAALRTFVATWVPLVIIALTAIPDAVTAITNEPTVPQGLRLTLASIATGAAALAGIITRIMAVKAVNDWLTNTINLGAKPKDVVVQENKELLVKATTPTVQHVNVTLSQEDWDRINQAQAEIDAANADHWTVNETERDDKQT